jgi:oligoendopeptidase F
MADIKTGGQKSLPKRNEIEDKFKWKLEDIYKSILEWEGDQKKVRELSIEIAKFKGILSESGEKLLECLSFNDELMSLNDKLFVYARMKRDENNSDSAYQALADRASVLAMDVYAATSFIVPEIISIPFERLQKFRRNNPGLDVYSHFIDEVLRQKKHVLSEREEELLALSSEMSNASKNIFTMFNNADIRFDYIEDESGEKIELTKGRYSKFLESNDRRVRKNAFYALYKTYKNHENTLASTLISNIKKNKFYSEIRNYSSSLEASLDSDNITINVYESLIKTINENLHLLHRYLRLRKKILKLDELHMYDLYVPLASEFKKEISYEEALEMVKTGLVPLGNQYIEDLKGGLSSGWVDIYENEGKTGGAYSWGAYKTHPYVLLNYQGTINDVFTIAHEMGHALHSFYTNRTQPYIYSEYKIFVAEVASTVNESLLMKHLLKITTDKKERSYLLNHYLEEFRGTVFRQVMFAEFEKIIYERIEKDEALTAEVLSDIYRDLNKKYFGDGVVVDDEISVEWARIPHFYTSFYVYKYATGFSTATSLSQQILSEGRPAIERYLKFLGSGASDYPLQLLKESGVDLSSPKPIQDALNVFEEILNELEEYEF